MSFSFPSTDADALLLPLESLALKNPCGRFTFVDKRFPGKNLSGAIISGWWWLLLDKVLYIKSRVTDWIRSLIRLLPVIKINLSKNSGNAGNLLLWAKLTFKTKIDQRSEWQYRNFCFYVIPCPYKNNTNFLWLRFYSVWFFLLKISNLKRI